MKIHHLNCATLRPFAFVLSDTATLFTKANLVVHCLVIESNDGIILVDSGFGIRDRTNPGFMLKAFMMLSNSSRELEETAYHQIVQLGYSPKSVRHIVQTHLHLDHAGGLPDFPEAQVHVHKLEFEGAMKPRSFSERFYVSEHWSHEPSWVLYDFSGSESWFGFPAVRIIDGVDPEMWLISLPGHTRGHCGIAIKTKRKWLFHCGDAYISRGNIDLATNSRGRSGWIQPIVRNLFPHLTRLRKLYLDHGDEIEFFCSHDSFELIRLQNS